MCPGHKDVPRARRAPCNRRPSAKCALRGPPTFRVYRLLYASPRSPRPSFIPAPVSRSVAMADIGLIVYLSKKPTTSACTRPNVHMRTGMRSCTLSRHATTSLRRFAAHGSTLHQCASRSSLVPRQLLLQHLQQAGRQGQWRCRVGLQPRLGPAGGWLRLCHLPLGGARGPPEAQRALPGLILRRIRLHLALTAPCAIRRGR